MLKNKKYIIRVDEEQLKIIMDALEMFSRLYIGQLEINNMPPLMDYVFKNNVSYENREQIDYHLNAVKKIIWNLPPNASSRAVDIDGKGDYSYALYKQMKFHIEKDLMKEQGKNYKINSHSYIPSAVNENNKIFMETIDKKVERREKLNNINVSETD